MQQNPLVNSIARQLRTQFAAEQPEYCSYKNYENNHHLARQNLRKNLPAVNRNNNKTKDFYQEANNIYDEQCYAGQYYVQNYNANEDMN